MVLEPSCGGWWGSSSLAGLLGGGPVGLWGETCQSGGSVGLWGRGLEGLQIGKCSITSSTFILL
jgi:hypothetical protein